MTQQTGQKLHHGACHAGHFQQQAQENKGGDGQQHQVRHALVHATNQGHDGNAGGQGQIAQGSQCKGEGDRHTAQYANAHNQHKENQQVDIAQSLQIGLDQPYQ